MSRQQIVPPALADAAARSGFSPAIRAGDFLFLTGATGGDAEGTMPSDAAQQTRNALSKVTQILAEVNCDLNAVVEMTSYHVGIDAHFEAIQQVLEEQFAAPLPAWTALEVAKLRRPGALIEFRFVAHCPASEHP